MNFDTLTWQWIILTAFGVGFIFIAPNSRSVGAFFSAVNPQGRRPGLFLLTTSLVISWIFAKSITNAADLGRAFGLVGGVAYAAYYLSFAVAGVVIYRMRTRGGFKSLHDFLQTRFGRSAVVVFSLLIGFRLFNEVWSNTMVIGSYFGERGSPGYFAAILVFTGLTLAYTLRGGLRSSLLTDAIQMVFFGVLLFVLLGIILQDERHTVGDYLASGSWEISAGLNLLFVALLQVFSYPFHDSVMTDRGFISDPKTTLRSFLLAAGVGIFCLTAFSWVGIYAQFSGAKGGSAAVEVGKMLGTVTMLAMNFIMITSAASTLDSAFSSFSKLVVLDLGRTQKATVQRGRLAMVGLTVLGTLPVLAGPEILSATTVSGTMVMGLAPVFLLWWTRADAWSFHLAVGVGIAVGVVLAVGAWPKGWIWFPGKYGDLLSANLLGSALCFTFYLLPMARKYGK
ncbi:MAG: sodium:solute symporter [Bacteroidota bacterium]